jgi:hypothetical protein
MQMILFYGMKQQTKIMRPIPKKVLMMQIICQQVNVIQTDRIQTHKKQNSNPFRYLSQSQLLAQF